MLSLLYNNASEQKDHEDRKKIIYHLSLDRSFFRLCADINRSERFFSVISEPLRDKDEIMYRREILSDFQKNKELWESFSSLYGRFDEFINDLKETKKAHYRMRSSQSSSVEEARNVLNSQAIAAKKAFLFIRGFGELLSKYELTSRGLIHFYDECRCIYENESFKKMISFCNKYEYLSTNATAYNISLDADGRVENFAFIDPAKLEGPQHKEKQKGFFLFRKAEEKTEHGVPLSPTESPFYQEMMTVAFSDISNLFASVVQQITDKFSSVYGELDFYDTALKYSEMLAERNIPHCFPKISDDGEVRVKELYDLYLLMSENSIEKVVPNDLEMTSKTLGTVVFGNNGSGKTVYLRSVATMQLLAQAGLPVPAKEAEISLVSDIVTQFSEAEKEFCEGNEAGRFEQEVRELAAMVDTLKDGSLVFLNETFQSTAYAEGAEGLYYLLKYFSERGIRWILVSHLKQIEDRFSYGEAQILHTAPGYKIVK